MIETRHLQYFLAIAREQNITRAANMLHISQPTLSKQMMDLEKQLGVQLFIRGKKKTTLTKQGMYFRNRAAQMIQLMEKTETDLKSEQKSLAGDIYIGCAETPAMGQLAVVFQQIQAEFPKIHFHVFSSDILTVIDRLDKGLLDIGLQIGETLHEKYDYRLLKHHDTFGLLRRRTDPLADRPVPLSSLANIPLLVPERLLHSKNSLDLDGFHIHDLQITATYNLIYNATFMVEQGMGSALCLQGLVEPDHKNLIFQPFIPNLQVNLYIVTKKYQSFSPAVKLFLQRLEPLLETK